MKCEDRFDAILDRLAGELNDEESTALEQHFVECARCEEEARRLEALLAGARAAGQWAVDPGIEARALEAVRSRGMRERASDARRLVAAGRPGARRLSTRPVPISVAAAAAVVCLAAGFWSGRSSAPRRSGTPSIAAPSVPTRAAAPAERTRVSSGAREERLFATAPSDAICLTLTSLTDTL